MTNDIINKELVNKIESLLKNAREKVVREVNNTLLITYMEIGKAIVEDEKLHIDDIEYENKSLRYLSKDFIYLLFTISLQSSYIQITEIHFATMCL